MKTERTLAAVVILTLAAVFFTSCEKRNSGPGDPVEISLTLKQKEVVDSANKFAFDLFIPVITGAKSQENIMISPFSVSSALSMTLNGAAGQTFEDMRAALRYDGKTIEEINDAYLKLISDMIPVDPRVIMEIANSVWIEKKQTVRPEFTDALKTWYKAEAKSIDAADPASVDIINGWIEDKTHDRIRDMLDYIDPDMALMLINAIYFKGQWRYQFDKGDTSDKPFYVTPDSPVQVPMMYQKNDFACIESDNASIIELPYGQGNYTMVVVLPDDETTIPELASSVTIKKWQTWMNDLKNSGASEVELSLPRFKYEYKRALKDDLVNLGMGIAFSDMADFSKINDRSLCISRVLHQTFIETNEEGTEAAAATIVEIVETSMPLVRTFNANRPFLYFIRETTTGTIVFMGSVINPLQD